MQIKLFYGLILMCLIIIGGCGQTGPLYLPGDTPPITVPDEEIVCKKS